MKKTKLYLALVIVLVVLLFASVFVTVALTGSREIGEMTGKDRTVFFCFLGFFVLDLVLLFVLANRLGKLTRLSCPAGASQSENGDEPIGKSPYEKALNRRGVVILFVSFVLALGLSVLGIVLGISFKGCVAVLITACVLPVLLGVAGFLLYRKKANSLKAFNAEERQNLFLEQRRSVEQKEREALARLKTLRRCIIALAVLLIFLGAVIALLSGRFPAGGLSTLLIMYAALLIGGGLSRLFVGVSEKAVERDESYVRREEFPYLYSLAEKAAAEMGCKSRIRIAFDSENNVGVARVGDTVSLLLGVYLIGILTENELYAILLHEFSHVMAEADNKEANYGLRLQSGMPQSFVTNITNPAFSYLDFEYGLQYVLYSYTVSVTREAAADEAMLRCGDKRTAASALIKVFYIDRSDWEDGTRDIESIWASEEPCGSVARNLEAYRRSIAERGEFWSTLIPKEIMARSATHPTLKMRLDALGVDTYTPYPNKSSAEYDSETAKAAQWFEKKSLEFIKPNYQKLRQHYYLDHMEKIEEWESSGRPLTAEGYRGVVEALRAVGRSSEAEALCDRAMAELTPAASAYACFIKANNMLRRYDPAGIELMYKAVEENSNYIDEGLEAIGSFCCITGSEAELERYRSRSLEIAQQQIDEYDHMQDLKKTDDLSPEHLPEGKLEAILAYIASIDGEGSIDRIFLVHKQITPEFFTSAFIIEFRDNVKNEVQWDIMDKIFNYLDTESDWQYCLFYASEVRSVLPRLISMEGCLVYSREK